MEKRDDDECWPWRGPLFKGYGKFNCGGRFGEACAAHRFSLAMATGKLDAAGNVTTELHALHRCDNRACCNPKHLYWGTNDDNIADKVHRGRSPKGVQHYSRLRPETVPRGEAKSKLTVDDVRAIRADYAAGVNQSTLARRYGLARTTISTIVCRRAWAHVA